MYVLDRQTALYDRLDDLDGLNRCLARAFAVADSHEEQLRLAQRLLDVARRDSNQGLVLKAYSRLFDLEPNSSKVAKEFLQFSVSVKAVDQILVAGHRVHDSALTVDGTDWDLGSRCV